MTDRTDLRDMVIRSSDQLQVMLDAAAERGAERALAKIGLQDEEAGNDVRDLRQLIEWFRDMKSTALRTIVQAFIMTMLGLLALGAGIKYLGMGK